MGNRVLSSVSCVVIGIAALGSIALQAQTEQRAMYVSVLDKSGAPIPAISPSDLVVREDGIAREILRIVPADEPMQIALLVDDSTAGEPYIREYRQAISGFITDMLAASPGGRRHQIALVGLASRPTIITDFSSDPAELQKGVDRIFGQPASASFLLDALFEITRGISRRGATHPVIIALSTEGPEYSQRHFDEVLEPLGEAGAIFHAITIGNPSNMGTDRSTVLQRGTVENGGQLDMLLTANALPNRLKQLAAELLSEQRVVYARPDSLIPPERATVTSAKPDLVVRGRAVLESDTQERR
ncbi:MAG: hypothetical protein AB7F99_00350 [Vicinamibacterales bacterium]